MCGYYVRRQAAAVRGWPAEESWSGGSAMRARQWLLRLGAVAAGALLAGPAITGAVAADAVPAHRVTAAAAHQQTLVTTEQPTPRRERPQSLPDTGFDGVAVAAIGTGLTGAGWLLMLVGSRQLRRRSR
jgi:hypothetical protein